MNFVQLLNSNESVLPNAPAIVLPSGTVSYQQFYQKVHAIAKDLPVSDSAKKIVVTTSYDVNCYAAIIAIWLTGNTYIPAGTNQISQTIEKLKPDLLLSNELSSERIKSLNIKNCKYEAKVDFKYRENSIAYILSTSGTTGNPKYIPVSYDNLSCFVDSFLALDPSLNSKDSFLQMSALKFDMSIISTLIPLCLGASIHTIDMEGVRSQEAMQCLLDRSTTICIAPPSAFKLLEPYLNEVQLPHLRHTFFGAEALELSLVSKWLTAAPNSTCTNLYGPSEGGIFATAYTCDGSETDAFIPIGKDCKNSNSMVVDNELWISGKQVFDGYLDSSLTDLAFEERKGQSWYRTGDMVSLTNEGNYVFEGRKDRQLKILGKRIELNGIEAVLNSKLNAKFRATEIQTEYGLSHYGLFTDRKVETQEINKILSSSELPLPKWIRVSEDFVFVNKPCKQENIANLYSLFRESIGYVEFDSFSAVQNEANWPNYIFDIQDLNESLDKIVHQIEKGAIPNSILITDEQLELNEAQIVRLALVPVVVWPLLSCSPQELLPNSFNDKISVSQIGKDELSSWLQLVESNFANQDAELFNALMDRSCELFIASIGTEKAGAAMTYTNQETTGIYHVSVLKNFQKQGVGSALIKACNDAAKTKGSSLTIMQSSNQGLSTWKNIGLKQEGNLYLLKLPIK